MSDQPLPSLPAEVEALLAAERPIPPAPTALEAAVWGRLEPTMRAPPEPVSGATASTGLLGKLVVAAISFAVGGAVVAVVDRTLLAPASATVAPPTVEPRVQAHSTPSEPSNAPTPPPPPERASAPVVNPKRVDVPIARPPEPSTTLAEERAIIEVARTALARGRTADVFSALSEHERRFERGQLSEERDFLRLQALVSDGRTAEARRDAQRFRTSYPTSVFLPAIDELMRPE